MHPMTALEVLRDRLAGIPGIASCRIGLEANITPDDYPLIRLVPSSIRAGQGGRRVMDLLIYFGTDGQPFDDTPDGSGRTRLEKSYAELFAIEAAILALPRSGDGFGYRYKDTITDEDRLDTYKLMAVRCEVEG